MRGGVRSLREERGVATVETALALPVLGLVLWLVGLAGVAGVDQLTVQQAAAVAARTAAATADVDEARAAAARTAAGRAIEVDVRPGRPAPGALVEVVVTGHRTVGPVDWTVRGRAHARVEPRP